MRLPLLAALLLAAALSLPAGDDLSPAALLSDMGAKPATKSEKPRQDAALPEAPAEQEPGSIPAPATAALSARPAAPVISTTGDRKAGEKAADDWDGDGLLNENEALAYGTMPKNPDSDGDGLLDGEEILGYRLKPGRAGATADLFTNPLSYDSDGDGLSDSEDPHPLIAEHQISFEAYAAYWKGRAELLGLPTADLDRRSRDYDRDGLDNGKEFAAGTCPLLKPGQKLALFAPAEIVLRSDCALTTSFSVAVFAHSSVTGVVCMSTLNTRSQLFPEHIQGCELPDRLNVPSDTAGAPFLARYSVPLTFTAIFPKATPRTPARDYIRLIDQEGFWKDRLPVVNPLKDCAPAVPEILMPSDNQEILEEGPVSLAWQLPENKDLKYHVKISLLRMGEMIPCETKELSGNCHTFAPDFAGIYLWQVAAEDTQGRFACSETRRFRYLPPSGLFDSDGDGIHDNEEIINDSDPDDPDIRPLQIKSPGVLPPARVKEYYSFAPIATGGVQPVKFFNCSPRLPRGFLLDDSGVLLAIPEQAGTFKFTLGARDTSGAVRRKIFTIDVLPQDAPQKPQKAKGKQSKQSKQSKQQ